MITSKDIERNGLKWSMIDTFAPLLKHDRKAFVVNSDKETSQGRHWFVMLPIDDVVFIVDSLGKNNKRGNDGLMLKIIKDNGFIPQFYNGAFQYSNDSMCGFFSIYIAKMLNKYQGKVDQGKLTPEIASRLVEKAFGKHPSEKDIFRLIKAFGVKKN